MQLVPNKCELLIISLGGQGEPSPHCAPISPTTLPRLSAILPKASPLVLCQIRLHRFLQKQELRELHEDRCPSDKVPFSVNS